MISTWDNPAPYLEWTSRLLGLGAVVATVERLWCRGSLRDAGPLAWEICRHNRWFTRLPGWSRGIVEPFMRWPTCLTVTGAHGLAGAGLICVPEAGSFHRGVLLVFLLTEVLWQFRGMLLTMYGADQVRVAAGHILLLHSFAPGSQLASVLCQVMLATLVASSYLGSGLQKRRHQEWRNGTALTVLLQHETFGNAWLLDRLRRHPGLARLATWLMLGFQLTFPLAFADPYVALGYLAFGLSMHIGIAFVMGINGFIWSMAALYPAVYYLASNYAK
jgi:hypothetical protein